MLRCGLLGETLGHSFSRELHAALGRYSYEYFEVAPAALGEFLTNGAFDALNVTIPDKQAVLPYLRAISPRARAAGAVNVILRRGGALYGDNTDFGGLEALLARLGTTLQGKRVLIAGSGGAASCARAVAEAHGAARAVCVSRSGKNRAPTYEAAYAQYSDTEVLINATPAGMAPDLDGCAVDLAHLPNLETVADMVYNPLRTKLVGEAQRRSLRAEGGLFMLTAQAVLAGELFSGAPFSAGTAEGLYRDVLRAKRSIVLIGMPGSGKSTLGAMLAQRLGREFVSTDALSEEAAGMPIKEIFSRFGEARFRETETAAIRGCAGRTGLVIATGGGAALYAQRRALYASAADRRVLVDGAPEETLKELMKVIE